jgi:RNA polymerase sigma-70 factor (ECF subfamily)
MGFALARMGRASRLTISAVCRTSRQSRRAWEDAPVERPDRELVAALRRGDREVFAEIVEAWSPALLRLARLHVPSHAVAEEVVQEAWLAVLRGLDRFEERASLRTWVTSIVLNKARTHGRRERRMLPFASLARRHEEGRDEPAIDPARFQRPGDERPGWWAHPPARWGDPEAWIDDQETRAVLLRTIASLPPRQREVITLRDVLGWSEAEACTVTGVTEGNERVLLHRARAKVRAALERHLAAGEDAA